MNALMYTHVQRSPMNLLLYLLAAFMFAVAWLIRSDTAPSIAILAVALVMSILALSFQTLTVSDGGDHLDIRYGPLNLFGTRIAYREITRVEPGQTALIDGWGIHFVPFRGWTLNLWGFECVKIWRGDKVIRIGTDDSEHLSRFLKTRLAARPDNGNGSG